MKKYLGMLEQKVEWIALAIGVGFMGYMAWLYVIHTPIQAQIGGSDVKVGDIDTQIVERVVTPLETAMNTQSVGSVAKPPSFVDGFHKAMSYADAATTQPSSGDALVLWPQTPPIKFSDMPSVASSPTGLSTTGGETATGNGTVVQLPKAPAPQILATRTDMSYVAPPGTVVDPNAAVAVNGIDKTWASILYSVDVAALSKQWELAKLPTANSNTVFVQVALQRQELKPDGSWSDPVDLVPLIVGADPVPPTPATGKATPDAVGYNTWAAAHQKDILQPGFYTILKGKKWAPPGLDSGLAQQEDKFDATKYLDPKADLTKLTMEQKRMVSAEKYKRQQEAAKQRAKSAPRSNGGGVAPLAPPPPEGGGGGGAGGGADQGPNDTGRPSSFVVADPAAPNAGAVQPPAPRAASPAKPGTPPTIAQLVALPIPGGEFDPSKWNDDHPNQSTITGWANDDTVEPGHTYRYRVIYRLKNPVIFAPSAVKIPSLADQFDIRSDPSEWSANIDVRPSVNFWLVRASDTAGSAAVEVFRWQGGEAKRKVFNITPGDAIGGKDGNIDFSTGWTLVDVRGDARTSKPYVLLMDANGGLHKRDPDTDATDNKYQELKQQSGGVTMAPSAASPAH